MSHAKPITQFLVLDDLVVGNEGGKSLRIWKDMTTYFSDYVD